MLSIDTSVLMNCNHFLLLEVNNGDSVRIVSAKQAVRRECGLQLEVGKTYYFRLKICSAIRLVKDNTYMPMGRRFFVDTGAGTTYKITDNNGILYESHNIIGVQYIIF